jgi:hypothetical protein
MSETPSLSADAHTELERLRSEAGDPALAGAGWGAKSTRPRAAIGDGSGGGPWWPPYASGVGRRGTARVAQGFDLTAGAGRPAICRYPLSGLVGPRRPRGIGQRPVRSPTAG